MNRFLGCRGSGGIAGLLLSLALAAPARGSDDFEREPIRYSQARPENIVSRLQARIDAGQSRPAFAKRMGYLDWLLTELQIPRSSQVLVFSKTSLQRNRISPRTPRAIYFNDDVHVGYCQNGPVMEVSVADPQLGAVFYTLEQDPEE